jgi:hypothetical protein
MQPLSCGRCTTLTGEALKGEDLVRDEQEMRRADGILLAVATTAGVALCILMAAPFLALSLRKTSAGRNRPGLWNERMLAGDGCDPIRRRMVPWTLAEIF